MRAALYLRTSTLDQTTDNQERELRAVAERLGHEVVEVYADNGISGAKGRDKRPAFDRLCRDATRRRFDIIMAWSVDRLGRSLQDLVAFLSEIHASRTELYLHQQGLDTSTPSGRAMFQMMGVFAEFERAMIAERVRSAMARRAARPSAARGLIRGQEPGSELPTRLATSGCGPLPRSLALPSKPCAAACQSLADRPKSPSAVPFYRLDSRQYLPESRF